MYSLDYYRLKLFQLNVTVFPPTIVAHNKILFVIWYMREALSWYKTYLVAIFFLLISLLFVVKIVLMACGVLYKRSFFRKLGYFCQLVTMQFMIVTARQIMQLNWAIVNTHLYFLRNLNFQPIQDKNSRMNSLKIDCNTKRCTKTIDFPA